MPKSVLWAKKEMSNKGKNIVVIALIPYLNTMSFFSLNSSGRCLTLRYKRINPAQIKMGRIRLMIVFLASDCSKIRESIFSCRSNPIGKLD